MTSGAPSGGGAGGGRPSESGGGYQERVLPTAQSILWNPTTAAAVPRRGPGGAFPVFLEQQAISAIQAHHQSAGKQGIMGFLVGDLCRCPTSQVKYVIIDSTVRLNQAVYGDKTLVIISRLWDRLQDELQRSEGHLIGWYHSHPPMAVVLAPGDVETHMQYFTRPWHTALVLGMDREGPVAGLFRPGPGDTWPTVSLPFYELIDDPDHLAGGFKTSILPWQNFVTDDTAVSRYGVGEAPATPGLVKTRSTLEVVSPGPKADGGRSGRASVTQPRPAVPGKAAPAPSAPPPRREAPPQRPPVVRADQEPTVAATRPAAAPPATRAPAPPPGPPPGKPTPAGKRGPPLKPPPGALTSLPLLSGGGYDVGPVEIRPSDPRVMTPQPQAAVPPLPPRRAKETSGQPPALKVEPPVRPSVPLRPALTVPKQEKHWGAMAVTAGVLTLLGAGGWYFVLGPGRPQFNALRGVATTPAPQRPATPAGAPTPAQPSAPTTLVVADTVLQGFDRLADSVTTAVRGYEDRAKLFGSRQLDCSGLSHGLETVEDIWTTYNVGKKKAPPLDAARTSRDQTLYAAVDSVERHFDRSKCDRP